MPRQCRAKRLWKVEVEARRRGRRANFVNQKDASSRGLAYLRVRTPVAVPAALYGQRQLPMLRRLYVIMHALCHNMRDASPAPDTSDYEDIYINGLGYTTCTHYAAQSRYQLSASSALFHCALRPVLAFGGVVLRLKRCAAMVNRK